VTISNEPKNDEVRLNDGVNEYIGLRTAIICSFIMADIDKQRREDLFNGASITEEELKILRKRKALREDLPRARRPRTDRNERSPRIPGVRAKHIPLNLDPPTARKILDQALKQAFAEHRHGMTGSARDIAEEISMLDPRLTTLWRKANPGLPFGLIEELETLIKNK
jgi:hypothetical protein